MRSERGSRKGLRFAQTSLTRASQNSQLAAQLATRANQQRGPMTVLAHHATLDIADNFSIATGAAR